MESMPEYLQELSLFISRLSVLDYFVVGVNLLLMLYAKQIVSKIYGENATEKAIGQRIHVLRALNLLIILSFGYYHLYSSESDNSIAVKLVSISLVVYFGYLSADIIRYVIRVKYGRVREVDGEKRSIETYNSRLLSLLVGIFIFVIVLLSIVNILEFDSLLEAGGVIGFIGVFFALTQNAWAPDIISGLVILNSGMAEEGDVIDLNDGAGSIGVVFKTKMFHTEILNLINNHRIMLKNTKLRELTIHNLSKFASARGLRENLHFKVAYDVPVNEVKTMFEAAFEKAREDADILIEDQLPLEVGVIETGDHAVEWAIYYYTKDVKNLIKTRQKFREVILNTANEYKIALATPLTHHIKSQKSNAVS